MAFTKFRKYQKPALAALAILCMISFIFSDLNCFYRGFGGGGPTAVAKTNDGTLTESDMDLLRRSRQAANAFMQQLGAGQVFFGNPSNEESVMYTRLMAKKAERMGIVVSDATINEFINDLTRGMATDAAVQRAIENSHHSEAAIFAALRTEILAIKLQALMLPGLMDPRKPESFSPAERWEFFQRSHRRIEAEVLAVPVESFFDKVPNPSDEELEKYFERYADVTANPYDPEPGFKLPAMARFQYVTADFNKFYEAERPKVTAEEIEERYNKNKDNYPYFGLPAPPDGTAPDADPTESPPPLATGPIYDHPRLFAPRPFTSPGGLTDPFRPSGFPDAPPGGNPDKNGEEDDGAKKSPLDSPAPGETPDPGKANEPESPCGQEIPPAAPLDEKQPAGQPVDQNPDQPAKTDPTNTDPTKTDPTKTDPTTTEPELPGLAVLLSQYRIPRDVRSGADPKHAPLFTVEEDIRRDIARERAAKAIETALAPLKAALADYQKTYGRFLDRRGSQPASFDASKYLSEGITLGNTTPWQTRLQFFEESPLGKLRMPGENVFQPGPVFSAVAFEPTLGLYEPISPAPDGESHLEIWKIAERPADRATSLSDEYIPGGEKVRDVVLRAWKLKPARELAKARADELAAQARASKSSLTTLQHGDQKGRVVAPFTWLRQRTLQEQMDRQGAVDYGEVLGLDRVRDEFMRTAYALPKGGVGVAMNAPEDTVYVIRVTGYEFVSHGLFGETTVISEEVARSRFVAAANGRGEGVALLQAAAGEERRNRGRAWLESLKKEAGLVWIREPRRTDS